MSLTIFANFRIDSAERLQRMKDSFASFRNAGIERWVINARGALREDALSFLTSQLGEKLISFRLESRAGWFHDSREMLPCIHSEYVLFWIEDHICICGAKRLDDVVRQMAEGEIEYLEYTWYGSGGLLREFDSIPRTESKDIVTLNFDRDANAVRQQNCIKMIGRNIYIISCCGIFSRGLFGRIVMSRHPLIRRNPKETPFDFEKRWDDECFLPIRFGIPKLELFAAIDDDNIFPGDSLFARGLYPIRVARASMLEIREENLQKRRFRRLRRLLKHNRLAQVIYGFLKRLSYQF